MSLLQLQYNRNHVLISKVQKGVFPLIAMNNAYGYLLNLCKPYDTVYSSKCQALKDRCVKQHLECGDGRAWKWARTVSTPWSEVRGGSQSPFTSHTFKHQAPVSSLYHKKRTLTSEVTFKDLKGKTESRRMAQLLKWLPQTGRNIWDVVRENLHSFSNFDDHTKTSAWTFYDLNYKL